MAISGKVIQGIEAVAALIVTLGTTGNRSASFTGRCTPWERSLGIHCRDVQMPVAVETKFCTVAPNILGPPYGTACHPSGAKISQEFARLAHCIGGWVSPQSCFGRFRDQISIFWAAIAQSV